MCAAPPCAGEAGAAGHGARGASSQEGGAGRGRASWSAARGARETRRRAYSARRGAAVGEVASAGRAAAGGWRTRRGGQGGSGARAGDAAEMGGGVDGRAVQMRLFDVSGDWSGEAAELGSGTPPLPELRAQQQCRGARGSCKCGRKAHLPGSGRGTPAASAEFGRRVTRPARVRAGGSAAGGTSCAGRTARCRGYTFAARDTPADKPSAHLGAAAAARFPAAAIGLGAAASDK